MRSFQEAVQLVGGNEGHILGAATAHDDDLVIVGDLIEHGGQSLAQAGGGRFNRHILCSRGNCPGFLYLCRPGELAAGSASANLKNQSAQESNAADSDGERNGDVAVG